MKPTFEDFKNYCNHTGLKPGRALSLLDFMRRVEDKSLVKNTHCGLYVPSEESNHQCFKCISKINDCK